MRQELSPSIQLFNCHVNLYHSHHPFIIPRLTKTETPTTFSWLLHSNSSHHAIEDNIKFPRVFRRFSSVPLAKLYKMTFKQTAKCEGFEELNLCSLISRLLNCTKFMTSCSAINKNPQIEYFLLEFRKSPIAAPNHPTPSADLPISQYLWNITYL